MRDRIIRFGSPALALLGMTMPWIFSACSGGRRSTQQPIVLQCSIESFTATALDSSVTVNQDARIRVALELSNDDCLAEYDIDGVSKTPGLDGIITKSFSQPGTKTVGVRVTVRSSIFAPSSDSATRSVTITVTGGGLPLCGNVTLASFTASANPTVIFTTAASSNKSTTITFSHTTSGPLPAGCQVRYYRLVGTDYEPFSSGSTLSYASAGQKIEKFKAKIVKVTTSEVAHSMGPREVTIQVNDPSPPPLQYACHAAEVTPGDKPLYVHPHRPPFTYVHLRAWVTADGIPVASTVHAAQIAILGGAPGAPPLHQGITANHKHKYLSWIGGPGTHWFNVWLRPAGTSHVVSCYVGFGGTLKDGPFYYNLRDFNRDGTDDLYVFMTNRLQNAVRLVVLNGSGTPRLSQVLLDTFLPHLTLQEMSYGSLDVSNYWPEAGGADPFRDIIFFQERPFPGQPAPFFMSIRALDGRTNYQSILDSRLTGFGLENADPLNPRFSFFWARYKEPGGHADSMPDLWAIKRRQTGSGGTEAHVYNGAGVGRERTVGEAIRNLALPLQPSPRIMNRDDYRNAAQEALGVHFMEALPPRYRTGPVNDDARDLFFVKRAFTGSGHLEMFIFDGPHFQQMSEAHVLPLPILPHGPFYFTIGYLEGKDRRPELLVINNDPTDGRPIAVIVSGRDCTSAVSPSPRPYQCVESVRLPDPVMPGG